MRGAANSRSLTAAIAGALHRCGLHSEGQHTPGNRGPEGQHPSKWTSLRGKH